MWLHLKKKRKNILSKSPARNFIIVIHFFKGYWQFFSADMSSALLRSSVANEIVDGDQMHSGCANSEDMEGWGSGGGTAKAVVW